MTVWQMGFLAENREKLGGSWRLHTPICDSLLPETVKIAVLNPYDRENGIDKTCGFRFFKYEQSCLPLFQLLNCAQQPWSDRINTAALQNAVLYAREYNKNCIEADQIAELRHPRAPEPAIICSRRRMHDGRMFISGTPPYLRP